MESQGILSVSGKECVVCSTAPKTSELFKSPIYKSEEHVIGKDIDTWVR